MGDSRVQAVAALMAQDQAFRTALLGASTVDDAIRIAGEHGIEATAEDFAPPGGADLSDADLEGASGGQATTDRLCYMSFVLQHNCA